MLRLGREDTWASPEDSPLILVHCAGVNRGTDLELQEGNVELAERAIALMANGMWTTIVYLNSTQSVNSTPYGLGKSEAAKLLEREARRLNARFVNLIVPNVFGENGRPNYNSVVATFCDRISKGLKPEVLIDREINLIHSSEVADQVILAIGSPGVHGTVEMFGTQTYVSQLAIQLQSLHSTYLTGVTPDLSNSFTKNLFNTLRSYLYPDFYPRQHDLKTDNRGRLVETIKVESGGQSFVSWTHPGITRGNHFHRSKYERFLVLHGTAEIRLRKLFDSEVMVFTVTGTEPSAVDIPTLHTHSITNVGETDLLTLFWTNEIFDPANSDTYSEQVEGSPA
jgi:UDP-2-acetamido-2,6-beta-L-arabino-hexul-4-ose reductase